MYFLFVNLYLYHLKSSFNNYQGGNQVLVTSVLAGTLLFTGVGASQHVHATDSVVNANNATNIAVEVMNKMVMMALD